VEEFYATKKGRRILKTQVADKKKNSHMYTKKQMKKGFIQNEYLAIKTENLVKAARERLVKAFKADLNKYVAHVVDDLIWARRTQHCLGQV